jgi:hypothetical protein
MLTFNTEPTTEGVAKGLCTANITIDIDSIIEVRVIDGEFIGRYANDWT